MKTYIVDSFTDEKFKGNPAGVCLVDSDITENHMLAIAGELNLSETAFIFNTDKANEFKIRYFSPKMEIPLCGHATLAASKILFEKEELTTIRFITVEDIKLDIKKVGLHIEMQFPIYELHDAAVSNDMLEALGLHKVINVQFNKETKILLLEIESTEVLAKLSPDFEALYRSHKSINGVLVTAKAIKGEYDFHSRYFWPWSGTNEDPVTGGTHTFLASYWSKKLDKTVMTSYQCSTRSGFMEVEIISRKGLVIRGKAVIVLEGHLML